MQELGKILLVLGALLALAGLLLWFGWWPRWLGRLPGDIRIERGQGGFYFPIATCIVISILLSLLFSFFRK